MRSILFLIALFCLSSGVTALAADVTGTWNFSTTTPDGDPVTAVFRLQSDGTKVTGKIVADFPGTVTLEEGVSEGDQITLKVSVKNEDGASVLYTLSGEVKGTEIKGVVKAQVEGQDIQMNWTARKA
jgi:hypothetical protein